MLNETIMELERFVTYNLSQRNLVTGQNPTDAIYMRVMEWTIRNRKKNLDDVQYLLNMIITDKKEQTKYVFLYIILAYNDSVRVTKVPAVTTTKLYKILGKVVSHSQFIKDDEFKIKDGTIYDSYYTYCVKPDDIRITVEAIREKLINHHTKLINKHAEARQKLEDNTFEKNY